MPAGRITPRMRAQMAERARIYAQPWRKLTRTQKAYWLTGLLLEWVAILMVMALLSPIWIPVGLVYGMLIAGSMLFDGLCYLKNIHDDEVPEPTLDSDTPS